VVYQPKKLKIKQKRKKCEMDKFLRLEFFKRQKINTKKDGIEFIDSVPKLKKYMVKCHNDIEEFQQQKVEEFENEFNKYNSEKDDFLDVVKQKQKSQKDAKKEKEKESLKDDLRAEILKELEKEKEEQLMQAFKVFIPQVETNFIGSDVVLQNIREMFLDVLKNNVISVEQKQELSEMKKQTEKIFVVLNKIAEKLEKMKSSK
jgi:hypothetical protein